MPRNALAGAWGDQVTDPDNPLSAGLGGDEQTTWLALLRQLIRGGFGGGSYAEGALPATLPAGLARAPGAGYIRGHDGLIYPNVGAYGHGGRLFVNPPGFDLQAQDRVLATMPPGGIGLPQTDTLYPPGSGQPPIVRTGDTSTNLYAKAVEDLNRFIDPRLAARR